MALIVQLLESASIGASTPSPATITLATGVPGPQGLPGDAATIAVGTTSTLTPGTPATVTNSGTSSAAVFNFGIPQGQQGQQGIQGIQGPVGPQGPAGVLYATSPLALNTGTSTLSIDLSAYATQSWVDAQGYLQAGALDPYITSAEAAAAFAPIAPNDEVRYIQLNGGWEPVTIY